MILPGHLSAAYLASRVLGVDLRSAMASAMAPDMVDKPLRWLLGWTPNDRIPAHTATAWALSTLLVERLFGRMNALGWATGFGAHLACDRLNAQLNRGRIYFWWPWRHYDMHTGPTGLASSLRDFGRRSLLGEAALTLFGIAVALQRYAASQREG